MLGRARSCLLVDDIQQRTMSGHLKLGRHRQRIRAHGAGTSHIPSGPCAGGRVRPGIGRNPGSTSESREGAAAAGRGCPSPEPIRPLRTAFRSCLPPSAEAGLRLIGSTRNRAIRGPNPAGGQQVRPRLKNPEPGLQSGEIGALRPHPCSSSGTPPSTDSPYSRAGADSPTD